MRNAGVKTHFHIIRECMELIGRDVGDATLPYQRRCNMRHELLTQLALFLYWSRCKKRAR